MKRVRSVIAGGVAGLRGGKTFAASLIFSFSGIVMWEANQMKEM